MDYVVDRIEGNFAILEDDDCNTKPIKIDDSFNVAPKEGMIFKYIDNQYIRNEKEEKRIRALLGE